MPATLNDLLFSLRGRLRDFESDTFHEVVLIDLLNTAQEDLINILPGDCLYNLFYTAGLPRTSGTAYVTLPSTFHKLVSVQNNSVPSQLISTRNSYLTKKMPTAYSTNASERPFHWVQNGKLYVYPTPTSSDITDPSTSCSPALAGAGAGNVDNGVHYYKFTFVSASGESGPCAVSSSVTVADKSSNGQVTLSSVDAGGSGTTARNIYRTKAGGSSYGPFYYVGQIGDNATLTFTDNIADAALGALCPSYSTIGAISINFIGKPTRMIADADECCIQQEYTQLLVESALMRALTSVGRDISAVKMVFDGLLASLVPQMAGAHGISFGPIGQPSAAANSQSEP